MKYIPQQVLALEALAYLGRRAAGYDNTWLMERLKAQGVSDLEAICVQTAPVAQLSAILDSQVPTEDGLLNQVFGNLAGFPYNTVGTYSPGFLLLYPLVETCDDDPQKLLTLARQRPAERLAGDLALMLNIAEESSQQQEMACDEFSSRVLAMSIPAESKVAILDLLHHGEQVLEDAVSLVGKAISCLEQQRQLLELCCQPFHQQVSQSDPQTFLSQTSALRSEVQDCLVRPFVFGLETLLASNPLPGQPVTVYCGILRQPLQSALASARGPEYDVYNAIKLLADRTRFDILCYLRDHDAYGQELAAKFGLSRNTIHHHMTKLLDAHMVKCTVDGNRIYYTVDQQTLSSLLDRQRKLLIPDEAPGLSQQSEARYL